MSGTRASCFYEGRVTHRRYGDVEHAFEQKLFMLYLDLDEADDLFAKRPLWSATRKAPVRLRRGDYPGPAEQALDESIRDLVAERSGSRPDGPVRLLTQLRYLGYGFNPASFFYCFDADGRSLRAVVVHVTNTPWGERHSYVVEPESADNPDKGIRSELKKRFHVSPFMPMDLTHAFRFSLPGSTLEASIVDRKGGRTAFSAGLVMERRELGATEHAKLFLRHPMPGLRTMAGIYWQALKLYLKGAAYHPHPDEDAANSKELERWPTSNH
jgi:DUF1365 family protein